MGPYYDSLYLMVRQLPERPEHHRDANAPRSALPIRAGRGVAPVPRRRVSAASRFAFFGELIRILRQPLRRSWASE